MKACYVIITTGFLLSVFGIIVHIGVVIAGVVMLLSGTAMLLILNTRRYKWQCPICGKEFIITVKENLLALNAGPGLKKLRCPACGNRDYCKGIPDR